MKPRGVWERTVTTAFVAFIGLGLSSGLLGVAWPSMQREFNLALDAVSMLYLVQTAAYALAGFAIGRLMRHWGSGTTLLAGMSGMGISMFGIAASANWLSVILFSLVFGLASGVLDAGLNLYLATYHSARQMSWLHACFGIGATLGPLIMTWVIERRWMWQAGYGIVGVVLAGMVLLVASARRQWRTEGFQTTERRPVGRVGFSETLRVPAAWLSMAIFVFYVGLEIGIGQWAFVLLTESRSLAPAIAGPWVSAYWGAFTGGRILFGVVADRLITGRGLRLCTMGMVASAFLFWWNPVSAIGLIGMVLAGFAQGPVFPLLMSDTAARVGVEHAENTIGLQMGAVGIGTAILPGLIGTLGNRLGLEAMAAGFVILAVLVFGLHELTHSPAIQ